MVYRLTGILLHGMLHGYSETQAGAPHCQLLLLGTSQLKKMAALPQFSYLFAIGTIFSFLDAWNIGMLPLGPVNDLLLPSLRFSQS